MSDPLKIETFEGITTLAFDRPERRNALDQAMYRALAESLGRAADDDATRVVILTGSGGYFTAGNDIAEFIGFRKGTEFAPHAFLQSLASFPKPVVAAVEGGAVGIGATMLQHCDFVFAGRSTRFAMPFISLGLCPEGGSSALIAQGPLARQAARWLMLGEPFSADDAARAGLVTEVRDDGDALAAAREVAARLARLSPSAMQVTKRLMRKPREGIAQVMAEEIDAFTRLLQDDEAQSILQEVEAERRRKRAG